MSTTDNRELQQEKKEEAAEARVHVAKWNPWIWVIPVIAIFFVGWLVVRYGMGGGDITVRFADARGLDRYSPVRFRGAKVGTVQKITIDENLGQVVVRISMDASMNHALKKGTRFWIVEPGLEGGGLGGILSGTYVGIAPGGGEDVREFAGQEYAPVLFAPQAGKTFILEARGLGSVSVGAPVQFQGMRVGQILGAEYDAARGVTSVHAFVVDRFASQVREGTRFWRGGGLNISLSGGGVSTGGASLSSLLSSPVAFYTPDILAGAPAATGSRFDLYESQATAEAATDGPQLTYLTYFPGPVQGLAAGTPVRMKGIQVGRVRDVRLRYVPESATLETPVTLEIDPRLLQMPVTASTTRAELRTTMNDALQKLVRKGMRASLDTSLVLPGASGISLEMSGTAGSAQLGLSNDPPIIPAASGDAGIGGALASITKVANTIGNLPLDEIAGHLRGTAQRLDKLVNDPRLDESVQHLNTALTDLEKVAATTRQNVGPIAENLRNASESAQSAAKTVQTTTEKASRNIDPIVQSLRNAATSAEAAAKRAQELVGTSQRQNYDVGELIKELTRAAEAVRSLASYLSENPDSLLKGRRK
jgi:paraquat-inducible protein B